MADVTQKIRTNLWFDTEAQEAAEFYTSVFGGDSEILQVTHYTEVGPREAGMVLTVLFKLAGQQFIGINGGPEFSFDEAISLEIRCKDQAEIDYFWAKLSEGGEEGPCGWLKDRYGLSWQVVPDNWEDWLSGDDTEAINRTMAAMLQMGKLDIKTLEDAYNNV